MTTTNSSNNTVTAEHPDYRKYKFVWEEMRHHLAGSRMIKSKGTKYLPMLGDEHNEEDKRDYEKYKRRAIYLEATKRTHQALMGTLLRKPIQITGITDEQRELFKQVTLDGYSLQAMVRRIISEMLATSRCGVLVERSKPGEGQRTYFVKYTAEEIINWRYERIEDQYKLTMVVLKETYVREHDRFGYNEDIRFRVLELVDGVYTQSVFEGAVNTKNELVYNLTEEVVPLNVGEPLDYIPFVFFTPQGNDPTVQEPVLSAIAEINTSHYMTSADLEHGRHFTGLPTAWVAGFDTDQVLKVGSQVAWVSSNANARAGFLEFTGGGLGSLERALAEKQEQMAAMGSRMMRSQRKQVESAEVARLGQSAETSTLTDIAFAGSESLTTLLTYWLKWQGTETPEVQAEFNNDFMDVHLDSATLTALLSAWMSGAISYETLFFNMQQGELIPDGTDVDTERDRIESAGPPIDNMAPTGDVNGDTSTTA